ncbi:MAG: hypothetical protein BWX47_02034 [candidate division Hyd24-12 bacterium ADurb.Bin004]|nr:MAG: hypothetical protein BWX47_02034 [candidate division Hyd24-12 bacterium ADurb.Bin004]
MLENTKSKRYSEDGVETLIPPPSRDSPVTGSPACSVNLGSERHGDSRASMTVPLPWSG